MNSADITHGDSAAPSPAFRLLGPDDSIEEITELLHSAYGRLASMGLRYLATWQDASVTRRRVSRGECWVGEVGGRVVATAVLQPPGSSDSCPYYERTDVATFHQFAVAPELQGRGHGSRLLSLLEGRAREIGATELALDTAEGATHLIAYYERRGYRLVGHADWDVTNYRSVVMSKRLVP